MSATHWEPPTGLEPRGTGRVIAGLLLTTSAAQGVVFYGHLETGLYLISALGVLVGIVAGLRIDGMAAIAAAQRREPQPSLTHTLWPLAVAPIVAAFAGLPLASTLIGAGREDASVLLLPLGVGLVVVVGSLIGWLTTGLVVWPLVHLVRWLLRLGGRDADSELVTLPALFLLSLVAAATLSVLAVGDAGESGGSTAVRGWRQWILTWTVTGEDPQQEAMLIVARVLCVLMVVCAVAWIVRSRRRDPATEPPATSD